MSGFDKFLMAVEKDAHLENWMEKGSEDLLQIGMDDAAKFFWKDRR